MNRTELERRTLHFALKIIEFVDTLPNTKAGEVVEFQLVKAGTSVGANYREANRKRELRQWLIQESRELLAIFTSAGRTSKAKRPSKIRNPQFEIRNNTP